MPVEGSMELKHSVRTQDSREDKHTALPTGSLSSLTLSLFSRYAGQLFRVHPFTSTTGLIQLIGSNKLEMQISLFSKKNLNVG